MVARNTFAYWGKKQLIWVFDCRIDDPFYHLSRRCSFLPFSRGPPNYLAPAEASLFRPSVPVLVPIAAVAAYQRSKQSVLGFDTSQIGERVEKYTLARSAFADPSPDGLVVFDGRWDLHESPKQQSAAYSSFEDEDETYLRLFVLLAIHASLEIEGSKGIFLVLAECLVAGFAVESLSGEVWGCRNLCRSCLYHWRGVILLKNFCWPGVKIRLAFFVCMMVMMTHRWE